MSAAKQTPCGERSSEPPALRDEQRMRSCHSSPTPPREYRSLPVKFDGESYNPDGLVVVKVPIIMDYDRIAKDDFNGP